MATPPLLLLAISCSAALAAPGPGADPAYGLIKTIQLFDDDAASADILRNEVFYSRDEDTQLVFPHNYAPEEGEGEEGRGEPRARSLVGVIGGDDPRHHHDYTPRNNHHHQDHSARNRHQDSVIQF